MDKETMALELRKHLISKGYSMLERRDASDRYIGRGLMSWVNDERVFNELKAKLKQRGS